MHFGFALKLSDIDLLDTFRFVRYRYKVSSGCLKNVFKTSSRDVFKRLQNMSSRRLQDTSSRRLQRNNFSSSKTSSRRLTRCLQRHEILGRHEILRWRRVQDVFKTCLEDVFKTNKCLRGYYFSIRLKVFCKIGVLRKFSKFTEKRLCWSVFLIELQAWGPQLY